jgi:hypothetical protein
MLLADECLHAILLTGGLVSKQKPLATFLANVDPELWEGLRVKKRPPTTLQVPDWEVTTS